MPSAGPIVQSLRHIRALLFVATAAVAGVAVGGGTVSAHTEFSGSTPSAGDVVAEPVDLVTLTFTGEAEANDESFVALDASGDVHEPISVSTPDNQVFDLAFDPPLAGGEIGLRWSVRSADGHPINGAFSFTVTAPVPTSTVPSTTTIAPTTTAAPATTAVPEPAPTARDTTPATTVPAVVAATDDASPNPPEEIASLDEFLDVDDSQPGESQATLGRMMSFPAVAFVIGGIAFLWTTLRGEGSEIRSLVVAVRVAGAIVALGAAIEYGGVARLAGEPLTESWSSTPGLAPALRIAAGLAVALGLAASTTAVVRRSGRSLSSAADTGLDTGAESGSSPLRGTATTLDFSDRALVQKWVPGRSSTIALLGCALMVVSFWFDGHTVSKGWRPLHAVTNSVHVVAGSVWVGGVVAMAAVVWSRRRRDVRSRAAELVMRFSSVAATALAAVVAAGLIMAVSVLDSFGDITGSEWGRLLLLKSAAVGLAALCGAYNHFRLLPAMEADHDDPALSDRLRSVITAEAILLGFVLIVTAVLVAAAT